MLSAVVCCDYHMCSFFSICISISLSAGHSSGLSSELLLPWVTNQLRNACCLLQMDLEPINYPTPSNGQRFIMMKSWACLKRSNVLGVLSSLGVLLFSLFSEGSSLGFSLCWALTPCELEQESPLWFTPHPLPATAQQTKPTKWTGTAG